MKVSEKKIKSFDNTSLYTKFYEVENAIATIFWVHGFAEHSGRYENTISFFGENNFNSIIFDLRGHGRSGGTRAFINSFQEYLKDIYFVYNEYKNRITSPLYVIGHSMGGLITIRLLEQEELKLPVSKAILSAPALGLKVEVPAWKRILANIVVNIFPKLAIPTGMDGSQMTHDKKIAEEYNNDPLVLKKATAGWFIQFQKEMLLALSEAHKIKVPVHIIMGDADPIISVEAVKKFFQKLPKDLERSLHFFKDFYHEPFSEVEREKALEYVLSLLKK